MACTGAANVFALAIDGTFDDAQNALKDVFGDQDFRKQHRLSAVNSINLARVLAQCVYYLSAWLRLVARRVEIDRAREEREVSLSASRMVVTAAAELALVRESSKQLLVAAIERALNSLSERDRLLIVAQTFEGATHEALAQRLGAPRSTVTAWLAEARERLSAAVKADLATQGLEDQELQSLVRALGTSR